MGRGVICMWSLAKGGMICWHNCNPNPTLIYSLWHAEVLNSVLDETDFMTKMFPFTFVFFIISTFYPQLLVSLVPSLQLPYGLGRGECREPCILWNTTLPSHTTSWHTAHLTRKPAAPMCQRKHCTTGNTSQCARSLPQGVARVRWEKNITAGQILP